MRNSTSDRGSSAKIGSTCVRAVLAAAMLLGFTAVAGAATTFIAIPGPTFVSRVAVVGEESQGLLLNANGKYFAPVFLPGNGNVCALTLIYRDNDADINVIARLKRKRFAVGGDAFAPPVLMAQVASSVAQSTIRRATDRTITQGAVTAADSFFYVELTIPGETLEILGAQVEFRTVACP